MVHMDSENKELNSKSDYATATGTHDISNSIILYPFAHQVGGHTQLLTLDKSTLCKPLIPRELLFYLNVPKELVRFVPSYKGVVQIRETGAGTYPPVVYQPLRSPKSPYAKFVPGSSSTMPARLDARLMSQQQTLASDLERANALKRLNDQAKEIGMDQSHDVIPLRDQPEPDASMLVPRFLHSPKNPHHKRSATSHDHTIGVNKTRQDHYSSQHQHHQISASQEESEDHAKHERHTRSCSEEISNASSDNTNGGYFSEDSSQSITDLCGSPMELKVQIRQCSDEKILKKNLSQDDLLRADYISRPNEKYLLLLENVASKYQLPCILDLKMGTRQHGDDATEEKRHRQIAKCKASTSASLGVRLCGMQVYQVDYGGFLWYDKYYGRKMDEEGLKRALLQYFHNGFQLNEDIIDDVIARLKLLSNAVEKSPSFRFYGTSLLIIHEGCTSRSMKRCPVDVRLIDFAHTICDYNNMSSRSSSSPSVLKSSSAEQLTIPPLIQGPPTIVQPNLSPDSHHDQGQISENENENNNNNNPLGSFRSVEPGLTEQKQAVELLPVPNQQINDAPMISHSLNMKISKTSIGPDKGLLFGLENLMRLLDDLKSQYHGKEKRQPMEKAMENLYIPVI